MRLNPNRKVKDLLNKNSKYKVIQNNIVNETNLNRNYFNMKSNDCNQCGPPFMHYKIPKKCFKGKKMAMWEYLKRTTVQYLTQPIPGTLILPYPQNPVNWYQPRDIPPSTLVWCRIGLWLIQKGRLPGRVF